MRPLLADCARLLRIHATQRPSLYRPALKSWSARLPIAASPPVALTLHLWGRPDELTPGQDPPLEEEDDEEEDR